MKCIIPCVILIAVGLAVMVKYDGWLDLVGMTMYASAVGWVTHVVITDLRKCVE